MPEFISRASWGARAPRSRTKLTATQGNTIHYEGPKMGAYSHESCTSKVRAIQAYHMDAKRWADIAYNTITCRHGYIYDGRGYGYRSAAQGTNAGNDQSYAHCVMIGVGDTLSEETMDAVRWIVQEYQGKGSGGKMWVHSDWHNTGCPGDLLRAWVRQGMPDLVPVLPPLIERTPLIVNAPVVTILHHSTWDGYLQVCADGGVVQQGNAPFYGSLGAITLNAPVVDGDVTPTGKGYTLLGADGGIFDFGDAADAFEGSMGGSSLNAPCVSLTFTPTGKGYWIGAKDGGVFAFGDAKFHGSVSFGG